jgi:hypothetical protein
MAGRLKPLDVARLVEPGKYPDGEGLYLVVSGPTSRNWSFRHWINGKERWHGLALQLLFLKASESMGNHDSEVVGACSVD